MHRFVAIVATAFGALSAWATPIPQEPFIFCKPLVAFSQHEALGQAIVCADALLR